MKIHTGPDHYNSFNPSPDLRNICGYYLHRCQECYTSCKTYITIYQEFILGTKYDELKTKYSISSIEAMKGDK